MMVQSAFTRFMNDTILDVQESNIAADALKFGVIAAGFAAGGFVGGACAYIGVTTAEKVTVNVKKHVEDYVVPTIKSIPVGDDANEWEFV